MLLQSLQHYGPLLSHVHWSYIIWAGSSGLRHGVRHLRRWIVAGARATATISQRSQSLFTVAFKVQGGSPTPPGGDFHQAVATALHPPTETFVCGSPGIVCCLFSDSPTCPKTGLQESRPYVFQQWGECLRARTTPRR